MILFVSKGKLEKMMKEVVVEKTRLQLTNYYSTLHECKTQAEAHETEFDDIKKEMGYTDPPIWFSGCRKYSHKPDLSILEKIDALYEYLNLAIKREKKAERIVVGKKKKGK
jgi:hypothetical protein